MTGLLITLLLQINPAAPSGVVSGVVLSSVGVPAAAVRVYAIPAGDPNAAASAGTVFESLAQTDASGRYRLEVPPGRYYIAAGSVESPTYFPNDTSTASARVITVSAGVLVPDVNFSRYISSTSPRVPTVAGTPLPPGSTGVLSGVIRNSDNSPASGISVAAVPASILNSAATGALAPLSPAIASLIQSLADAPASISPSVSARIRAIGGGIRAVTDSTGRYRIDSVSPDSYYLMAGFSDSPVFYPGSGDIKFAATITTTSTTMLDALHFNLPAATRVPIRVRVLGRDGVPVSGASLELSNPDAPSPVASFLPKRLYVGRTTGDDGIAGFPMVHAGKYTLSAKLAPAAPVVKVIEIKDQPPNVELSLPVNVVIGRVLWPEGTSVSDPMLNQIAFSTTVNPQLTATTIVPISQGGEFKSVLDSKEYRVFIRNLPERYQVESITSGAEDLTLRTLKLDDDHPVNLQIRVVPKKNAIVNVSGRILDVLSGMPAAADRVQLCCFASGPFERLSTELLPDGSFQFSGVPAGRFELEMKGKMAGRIVDPLVVVDNQGQTRLKLLSAQQFANLAIGISTDGSIQRPQPLDVSVTFTPTSGETFRVTASGPVDEVLSASVPMGIPYDVSIRGLPAGFRVKSMSGSTGPVLSPDSPAGSAGVYQASSNATLMITLTRSD
jgi:hypothetical protein